MSDGSGQDGSKPELDGGSEIAIKNRIYVENGCLSESTHQHATRRTSGLADLCRAFEVREYHVCWIAE